MDQKEAFTVIRKAASEHPDKEGVPIALALIDVVEELMSKLERIAVAVEHHLELADHIAISPTEVPDLLR